MATDGVSAVRASRVEKSESKKVQPEREDRTGRPPRIERQDPPPRRNEPAVVRTKDRKTDDTPPYGRPRPAVERRPERRPEPPKAEAVKPEAAPAAPATSSPAATETKSVSTQTEAAAPKNAPPVKRRERVQLEIGRELGFVPKEVKAPVVAEEKPAAKASEAPVKSESYQSPEQQLEQFFGEQALATIGKSE